MNTIQLILEILAVVLTVLSALMSILIFIRLRWPAAIWWMLKVYVTSLTPVLIIIGIGGIIASIAFGSIFLGIISLYVLLVFSIYLLRITDATEVSAGFEKVFGRNWKEQIQDNQRQHFLSGRYGLWLPKNHSFQFDRDVIFAIIPGTERSLLCDIWQPPVGVAHSGLAFIYIHGSAFYMLDKDFMTRPWFSHMVAQGHVVMDVAYRLSPETDVMGMIHDVKRAVAWMKDHADFYKIDRDKIVIAGGSAGGHLALMVGFTANDPHFTPSELPNRDLNVAAVVSLYGTSDFEAVYYHTNQHLTTRSVPGVPKKPVPTKMPGWAIKMMGESFHRLGFDKGFENAGALAPLLGGHPDEIPATYAMFSPLNHVHPDCPPVFLMHGEHDIMAPIQSTYRLYERLTKNNVPVIKNILPQTDHAFDLFMPGIAPHARITIYDVERYLALIANERGPISRFDTKQSETSMMR